MDGSLWPPTCAMAVSAALLSVVRLVSARLIRRSSAEWAVDWASTPCTTWGEGEGGGEGEGEGEG